MSVGRSRSWWTRSKRTCACSRGCCAPTLPMGCERRLYALFVVHFAIRALMYRSALEAELGPDFLSFTVAVFQICEAVADQRGADPPAIHQWPPQPLSDPLRPNPFPHPPL